MSALAAALAVASAFLALQTAQVSNARDEAQQAEQSTGNDLTSLQQQFDDLESANQQLKVENNELRSQLDLPEGPTAGATPVEGVTIRHNGLITLSYMGNEVDLDSPESDPQWQTGRSDVRYGRFSNSAHLVFPAQVIQIDAGQADYDACRSTTGYKADAFPATEVAVGDYFCVKTDEKRYSAIRVTALTDEQLSLDVVSYDPPVS